MFGVYLHQSTAVVAGGTLTAKDGGAGGAGGPGGAPEQGGSGGASNMTDPELAPGCEWETSPGAGGKGGKGSAGAAAATAAAVPAGRASACSRRRRRASSSSPTRWRRRARPEPAASTATCPDRRRRRRLAPTLADDEANATVADFDGDGRNDADDACPAAAADASDADGCVDRAPALADGDADDVPDSADACPGVAAGVSTRTPTGALTPAAGAARWRRRCAGGGGGEAVAPCPRGRRRRAVPVRLPRHRRDVRHGKVEIPGNGVDENCDRIAAPFPKVGAVVKFSTETRGPRSRVLVLTVKSMPAGGELLLTCKPPAGRAGRGACPFKRVSKEFPEGDPAAQRSPSVVQATPPAGGHHDRIARDGTADGRARLRLEVPQRQAPDRQSLLPTAGHNQAGDVPGAMRSSSAAICAPVWRQFQAP